MKVEVITKTSGEYASVRVVVDGHIGGEPEDNSFQRDYAWVNKGFARLARALGAEVTSRVEKGDEDDDT